MPDTNEGGVLLLFLDEEHFNSNVQLRRTARHDVSVAKEFQDEETQSFQQQEKIRLQHLRER